MRVRGIKIVKAVAVGAAVCTLVLGGAYGVLAATTQTNSQYPPLVERIAKAFNLDPAKVENVFQEERKERLAKRNAIIEERLDQMVADNKITAAQKDAILKKIDEIQNKIESLRDKTPDQRMTEMQNLRSDLQAWAKENGLDNIQGIPGLKLRKAWKGFMGGKFGAGGCDCGLGGFGRPNIQNGFSGPGGVNSGTNTTSNSATL